MTGPWPGQLRAIYRHYPNSGQKYHPRGKVYQHMIGRERRGDYLRSNRSSRFVYHQCKNRWLDLASGKDTSWWMETHKTQEKPDIYMIELSRRNGERHWECTVRNSVEAVAGRKLGNDNFLHAPVSLVPVIKWRAEDKAYSSKQAKLCIY